MIGGLHTMIMQDLKGQRHEMLDPFLVGKTLPGPQTCMNRLKRSYFIYHFGKKLVFAHSL